MYKRGEKRTAGTNTASTSGGTAKNPRRSASPRPNFAHNVSKAEDIMTEIDEELSQQSKNLVNFVEYIKSNIPKLDTSIKKKTTVGVFGKSGSGKSSLINAILGEKFLVPSGGNLDACTSVITQIEANTTDSSYRAEIEFITKEAWKGELNSRQNALSNDGDEKDFALIETVNEKITALYGEKGLSMTLEDLMKDDNFSKVPEFLTSKIKEIKHTNALEFSAEIRDYIQHDDSRECYWPVVKCVTIKVPNCKDFLEHVVLLDLPGTGDYNKSRDQMWRSKLKECSTVWVVSDITRSGSENEAWNILECCITDLAQRGECSSMSFICTKTDIINPEEYRFKKLEDGKFQLTEEACILNRNADAKEKVKKAFRNRHKIKTQFNCDDTFLSVYTVSSKEYTRENPVLKPEDTEIPKLRDLLKGYNNSCTNERKHHYISQAIGILSLIQGSKESNDAMMAEKSALYKTLEKDLRKELEHLNDYCAQIHSSLEELLSIGAKESEDKWQENAKNIIIYTVKDNRGFHRTLTALCENYGFYRSKTGETLDLNRSLAHPMEQKILQTFSVFFTVQPTEKSLLKRIEKFSIIPEDLIKSHEQSPVLRHMLKFLQIEEMKLKTDITQEIIERKKKIFDTPSLWIKKTMKPSYQSAADIYGSGSMTKKQEMLLEKIRTSKSTMFQNAKRHTLHKLYETLTFTTEMKRILTVSMEYALLNANTLPSMDISAKLEELKKLSHKV